MRCMSQFTRERHATRSQGIRTKFCWYSANSAETFAVNLSSFTQSLSRCAVQASPKSFVQTVTQTLALEVRQLSLIHMTQYLDYAVCSMQSKAVAFLSLWFREKSRRWERFRAISVLVSFLEWLKLKKTPVWLLFSSTTAQKYKSNSSICIFTRNCTQEKVELESWTIK